MEGQGMVSGFGSRFRRLRVMLVVAAVPFALAPAVGWSADQTNPPAGVALSRPTSLKPASQVISVSPSDEFLTELREEYGEREMKILARDLTREVDRQLRKAGLTGYQVALVIHDARPNRPTFEQLSDNVGLSFSLSFGLGGADVEAKILSPQGELLRSFRYDWDEYDLGFSNAAADTWFDARRAFYFFAQNLRKDLQRSPPVGTVSDVTGTQ